MSLGDIVSRLAPGSFFRRKPADFALIPLNPQTDEPLPTEERAFQYWPETLSDTKGINYTDKEFPGASDPLVQWVSGGARDLSFTAVFTRDKLVSDVSSDLGDRRNPDINAAVAWLRQFAYPDYDSSQGYYLSPPPKLLLYVPNTKLMGADKVASSTNGQLDSSVTTASLRGLGDLVPCVMTKCDVDYKAWWSDGSPRHVEVTLSFRQIVQLGGKINYIGRKSFSTLADKYKKFNG